MKQKSRHACATPHPRQDYEGPQWKKKIVFIMNAPIFPPQISFKKLEKSVVPLIILPFAD